ncbi:MAG: hypothetical protein ACK5LO_14875 [Leucobacter sp.]
MNTEEFLAQMNAGQAAVPGTELTGKMHELADEVIRVCMELNTRYTAPE